MHRRIRAILGLVAFISCSATSCSGATRRASPEPSDPPTTLAANATFVRTVDGDTIDVLIGETAERVRLIGIDTPESVDRDTPVECFAREASAFTGGLLTPGTPLYLERDVEARDAYGRLLAYVYRLPDGLFVNLELARQGYAHTLTFPPNVAHTDEFVEATRAAEAADLGLWGSCRG